MIYEVLSLSRISVVNNMSRQVIFTMMVLLGFSAYANDNRIPIELNAHQKTFVLGHMRDMLETLTDTQQLLLEGNREAIEARITQLQSHEQAQRPAGLGKQIPPAFRAMAQNMRPHWQVIKDPDSPENEVRQQIVELLRVCNACHRTFSVH